MSQDQETRVAVQAALRTRYGTPGGKAFPIIGRGILLLTSGLMILGRLRGKAVEGSSVMTFKLRVSD
jgi:hypothetical protein